MGAWGQVTKLTVAAGFFLGSLTLYCVFDDARYLGLLAGIALPYVLSLCAWQFGTKNVVLEIFDPSIAARSAKQADETQSINGGKDVS
jgi:hypothetical protein